MNDLESKETELINLNKTLDDTKKELQDSKAELKQVEEKFFFVSFVLSYGCNFFIVQ